MTNQINYRSKEWAEDVASRLDDARVHVAAAASALRSVAADMDADGKDVERGPHAPPIQDVQSLLNIATSLLAMQTSNWQGYAFHRPETTL